MRRWGRDVPDWTLSLGLPAVEAIKLAGLNESHRKKLERFRLFTPETRRYLRRRAWRYFRRLGRRQPDRYVPAVVGALMRYRDEDVADGLALLDNWGLVHALFHHSPVLEPHRRVAAGRGAIAGGAGTRPMFVTLSARRPRAFVDLLAGAACRAVRQWASRMIRKLRDAVVAVVSLEGWLGLLGHDDPEVAGLAAEMLRSAGGLDAIPPARWLALLDHPNPAALEVLVELIRKHLPPEQVAFADAARLAMSRPLPLARLGFDWLRARTPAAEPEFEAVLHLAGAECEPLRPEILGWARVVLASAPGFRPDWVLAFLDSRHADVRAEGMRWFRSEPRARDDVEIWRKLLESPHDDVRLALVAELETRTEGRRPGANDALDPEALRLLWASVLLNVQRGSRAKPGVVRQVRERIERTARRAGKVAPAAGRGAAIGPRARVAGRAGGGGPALASGRPRRPSRSGRNSPELQLA